MKKILCPTDLSETGQSAMVYAAKLAQATQCDLTLLNVQSVFDFTPAEIPARKDRQLAGVAEQLETKSRQISKAFKIGCHAEVGSNAGRLSTLIHEKANDYDLIVMGSDGPDDLYQFFGGSDTYNAIAESETPLLLVPSGYGYSGIKTIVYVFDHWKEKRSPLNRLVPVVRALGANLTILQIIEEDTYREEAAEDLPKLEFMIRDLYGDDLHFRIDTIRSSEAAESFSSYILRNQPDALALCLAHSNLMRGLFHKSGIRNIAAFCSIIFHP